MDKSTLESLGHHKAKYTDRESTAADDLSNAFMSSVLPVAQRLQNFARHVRRQDIARFLVKYELFKLSLPANGSIVECGVFAGGGLFAWQQFSSILEPYNHTRKVIGFDTFEGFPSIHSHDSQRGVSDHLHEGAFRTSPDIVDELETLCQLHDRNRPLGHLKKIELVKGDATKTIPTYLTENPHLLISLIYLDFDIYQPTKAALDHLLPRVVKGGVVAFDELNCKEFPGETTALLEAVDLCNARLCRLPYDPYISYFIKE